MRATVESSCKMRERSREEDGKISVSLKISLAGRVSISTDSVRIDEGRLPGRQGRLVFAYLVSERGRPVLRDELAEALWGETPPPTWEKALGGIASKLRALLGECGLDGAKARVAAGTGLPLGQVDDPDAMARPYGLGEGAAASELRIVAVGGDCQNVNRLCHTKLLVRSGGWGG